MNAKQARNFAKKVQGDPFHATECARWTGARVSKTQKGNQHGNFWYNGKHVRAHSLMYHNFVGQLPGNYGEQSSSSLRVLHKCDTDGRCVNIHHLYLGTQKQNAIDRVQDGNNKDRRKLTVPQVREIRVLLKGGTLTQIAIGKRYGVSRVTISDIKRGRRWAWLK
jgi:hypothetical protein